MLNKKTRKFHAGRSQARQFKAISDKAIPEEAILCNVRQANPGNATLVICRQDNPRQSISRQNNSRQGNSRILQAREFKAKKLHTITGYAIPRKGISGNSKQGNSRSFQKRPLQSKKFQEISGKAIPDKATPGNLWKWNYNQEHFWE